MTTPDPRATLVHALTDARVRINVLALKLDADELAVLEQVAHGLATGRRVFGPLDADIDSTTIRGAVIDLARKLVELMRRAP